MRPHQTTALTLITLLSCLSAADTVLAWGTSGHRITAQVAEDHLSPAARQAISEITGPRSLAQIATWPDFVRSDASWNCSQPWHFLTVEDDEAIDEAVEREVEFRNCSLPKDVDLPQNVVQGIEFFTAILEGDEQARSAFQKLVEHTGASYYDDSLELTALTFLVHLTGDVHQPLHVGRGGDLGGNRVAVNWFDEVSNLHSTWDEGLISKENLSFSEFVRFLEAEEGEEFANGTLGGEGAAQATDPRKWAQGSRDVRLEVYEIYGSTSFDNHLPNLSYQYSHDHIGTVKARLYLGGRHLATRLNQIFGRGARSGK